MAKLPVIKLDQSPAGEVELSDEIAATPYHPYIIKDAVVHYQAGLRQGTHSTKGRSEVAGSTKKPYRQKGTGRARAGSVKSPIWRKGGIVFGPKPRSHALSINKKVLKHAMRSALAEKIRREELKVIESFELESHKTKAFAQSLNKLDCDKCLIVVDDLSNNLRLASNNLSNVEVVHYTAMNVYRVLRYPMTLISKGAIEHIERRLTS